MDRRVRSRLRTVSTATVTMQLLKRGFRNVSMRGVRPLVADGERLVGEAYTLRLIPYREDLAPPEVMGRKDYAPRLAIESCPPDAVLVVDARGVGHIATTGDILLTRLKVRGVAGFVTDGGVRDALEAARVGLPVYSAGPAAPPAITAHAAGDLGTPIGCGGVAVIPGDVVVGDGDGVVVIPKALAASVARDGVEQERFERFVKLRVDGGRSVSGLYPPNERTKAEYRHWCEAGEPDDG